MYRQQDMSGEFATEYVVLAGTPDSLARRTREQTAFLLRQGFTEDDYRVEHCLQGGRGRRGDVGRPDNVCTALTQQRGDVAWFLCRDDFCTQLFSGVTDNPRRDVFDAALLHA